MLAGLAAAATAGALLGACYFGGLWWTVRRMPRSQTPLLLYFGSLLIRSVAVLALVYGVLVQYGWHAVAVLLIGFVAARMLLIRRWGRAPSAGISGHETL